MSLSYLNNCYSSVLPYSDENVWGGECIKNIEDRDKVTRAQLLTHSMQLLTRTDLLEQRKAWSHL